MAGLKGHAKIELTNVKTGEVKVVEEDNLITNFLRDSLQYNPFGESLLEFVNHESVKPSTLIDALFGGILLFDKKLEEDPDKYRMPKGVLTIGQGNMNAYTGEGLTFGSYNSSESYMPSKFITGQSIKKVWDFSTSQANGSIGCICLCPVTTGTYGMGVASPDRTINSFNYPYTLNKDDLNYGIRSVSMPMEEGLEKIRDTQAIDYDNYKVYRLYDCDKVFNKSDRYLTIREYDINPYEFNLFKPNGLSRNVADYNYKSTKIQVPSDITELLNNESYVNALSFIDEKNAICYITFTYYCNAISSTQKIATMIINMKTCEVISEIIDNPFADSSDTYICGYCTNVNNSFENVNNISHSPTLVHGNGYIVIMVRDLESGTIYNSDNRTKAYGNTGMYIINCKTGKASILKDANNNELKLNYTTGTRVSKEEQLTITNDNSKWEILWESNLLFVNGGFIRVFNNKTLDTSYSTYNNNNILDHAVIDMESGIVKYINDSNASSGQSLYFSRFYTYYNTFNYRSMLPCNYVNTTSQYLNTPSGGSTRRSISSFGLYPFCLSTINNLESPIEKTDEQMMKITYELTITE